MHRMSWHALQHKTHKHTEPGIHSEKHTDTQTSSLCWHSTHIATRRLPHFDGPYPAPKLATDFETPLAHKAPRRTHAHTREHYKFKFDLSSRQTQVH